MSKEIIWESVKEPLRWVLLAILALVIQSLLSWVDGNELMSTENTILITAFLRMMDKIIHDLGKNLDSDSMTKGITRF
jgi:hypothetical protein